MNNTDSELQTATQDIVAARTRVSVAGVILLTLPSSPGEKAAELIQHAHAKLVEARRALHDAEDALLLARLALPPQQ